MNFKNLEWYRTGRVTAQNGGNIIKGTNTEWLIGEIRAGDIFTIDGGQFYEIASITNSSELVLKTSFSGESVKDHAYAIIRRVEAVMQAEIAARLANLLNKWEIRDAAIASLYKSVEITIPTDGWIKDDGDTTGYPYYVDISNELITENMTPILTISLAGMKTAREAGIGASVQTLDKALRVFSQSIPKSSMRAALALWGMPNIENISVDGGTLSASIPAASDSTLGGVRVQSGSGLKIDTEGNLSIDTATPEEVVSIYERN